MKVPPPLAQQGAEGGGDVREKKRIAILNFHVGFIAYLVGVETAVTATSFTTKIVTVSLVFFNPTFN